MNATAIMTPREPTGSTTRYAIDFDALQQLPDLAGEPAFRARQLWEGLYPQRRPLDEITNIARTLRAQLETALPYALSEVTKQQGDGGDTTKWLWRTGDGAQVETVLMEYRDRATVCVSSQAGCAMGCTFCATGQAGFERQLRPGEIIEQVMRAAHASNRRASNVVFMGMGEPLANFDAVQQSIERLHSDAGFSARHITVSTVGVIPGMRALADQPLPVTLAVSVHAPDDELRNELVPLNRRYPLSDVIDAARDYAARKGRRVTFEYAGIRGVNDDAERARKLARLLQDVPGGAHVNLIPLNATAAFTGGPSADDRLRAFAATLGAHGVTATIRRNRGVDIDAACGQLRARAKSV
ncbi:MAG TPA: 23S rRNA (adenine(2503)-C(2))-methyltransferase RlmN [Acidimicrobiia bacterium]|jgi:23S rRNA (adenine2503-C2)-methyltransferase